MSRTFEALEDVKDRVNEIEEDIEDGRLERAIDSLQSLRDEVQTLEARINEELEMEELEEE